MKKIVFISICILYLISSSCSKDNSSNQDNFTSVFGIYNESEARKLVGDYYVFGMLANGGLAVRSESFGNSTNTDYCRLSSVYRSNLSNLAMQEDGGDFHIEKISLDYDGSAYQSNLTGVDCVSLDNLYGQSISYSLDRNGTDVINNTKYSPKRLTSFEPNIKVILEAGLSHYILDGTQPFEFTFNADVLNVNKVLVVAMGKGDVYQNNSTSGSAAFKYEVKLIDDDGTGSLPTSFFSQFQDDELITISLYRGAFVMENGLDGNTYKVYTLSEASQEFKLDK